ncbi:MAG: hypothetical protein LBO67_06185 [Spirochaetaceae bacterium]|jgi:hypothetical protein|nr:hypothetical protein [Spirochaetaceae bacterium]
MVRCLVRVYTLLFFFAPLPLFAAGSTESAEPVVLNKEWVLCITDFDVSAIPVSQHTIGTILVQNIVKSITVVTERRRTQEEYAYYEQVARAALRSSTAQELSKKRNERDQLIFRGYPSWKYRKNLRTFDKDIAALEQKLSNADTETVIIEAQPVFKLSEDNAKGVFPPRPRAGDEARFCASKKSDALLAGSVSSFHGRLYCTIALWTLYNNAYHYETALLFSLEETAEAVDDLASDLIAALSGIPPAHLAVNVEPDTALITVDGIVAGQGSLDERPYRAGAVALDLSAQDYEAQHLTVTTNPDELLNLSVALKPITYGLFKIEPSTTAAVYLGSRYLGQSPLEAALPVDEYGYFRLESDKGEVAQGIAVASSDPANVAMAWDFKVPLESPETLIEKNRKSFYNAFGRFWIALPIAFIMQGIATEQSKASARTHSSDLYKQATTTYYISLGTWVVFGITAADMLYRSYRYLSTAHDQSVSLIK